jgi:hypothetical protein
MTTRLLWILLVSPAIGFLGCSGGGSGNSDGVGNGGSPMGGAHGGNGGTSSGGGAGGNVASGGLAGGGAGAAGGGTSGHHGAAGSAGGSNVGGISGSGGGVAGARGLGGTPGCGTLANTASPVAPTSLASILRDYAGGNVQDGIYELISVEQTDPINLGAEYQRTLSIQAGATVFEWAIQDMNVTGSGTYHLAGSLALSGSAFNFAGQCAPSDNYYYSASGRQLTLYFIPTTTVEKIFHFQLSQLPPG